MWLLPFFAATGIRDDWQMLWVHLTVLYFIAYQAADQLFIWQFLAEELVPGVRFISWGVSIAAIAWLLLVDRHTRTILPGLLKQTPWLAKFTRTA
ncbi:hypothetical protein [Arthrobacter sp. JCM 19049]|uniref:hypothetical protein n=1 Tax=Arthrobacter sp. JCM 19049 TaxID=1460643 RepID=UPI0024373203|nr:hypothetical protein [Arthrobacter sp. JCM 19049]